MKAISYEGLIDACDGNTFESLPITTVFVSSGYKNISFCGLKPLKNVCGNDCHWSYDVFTMELTISGTGKMDDYDDTNKPQWYDIKNQIKSITISPPIFRSLA